MIEGKPLNLKDDHFDFNCVRHCFCELLTRSLGLDSASTNKSFNLYYFRFLAVKRPIQHQHDHFDVPEVFLLCLSRWKGRPDVSDEGLRVAIGGGLEGLWGWRWGYRAAEGQSWVEPNAFFVFLMLIHPVSQLGQTCLLPGSSSAAGTVSRTSLGCTR